MIFHIIFYVGINSQRKYFAKNLENVNCKKLIK